MTKDEQKILYSNLGVNIKEARVQRGFKQDTFADMLKLSRASIVNIEKGRQRPTLHLLYEISSITNTDLFDLLPKLSFDDKLNSTWKDEIQKTSTSIDSKSEEYLSNFLIEVTQKNKENGN